MKRSLVPPNGSICDEGHCQKQKIEYDDTFAPVRDRIILRFVITLALYLGYKIFQLHIDTAYSYSHVKVTIYIFQPQSFDDGLGRVCRVQQCKMASRNRKENSSLTLKFLK